jgi:hypothetical protein
MNRKIFLIFMLLALPAWAADWQPTEAQMRSAEQTASVFVGALASGETEVAYNLFTPSMKKMAPKDEWMKFEKLFQEKAGGGVKYWNTKVTWYKDPKAQAGQPVPEPGTYAAFDMNCSYNNIPECGETLILYEQDNGTFLVRRYERNLMGKSQLDKAKEQGAPGAGMLTSPN